MLSHCGARASPSDLHTSRSKATLNQSLTWKLSSSLHILRGLSHCQLLPLETAQIKKISNMQSISIHPLQLNHHSLWIHTTLFWYVIDKLGLVGPSYLKSFINLWCLSSRYDFLFIPKNDYHAEIVKVQSDLLQSAYNTIPCVIINHFWKNMALVYMRLMRQTCFLTKALICYCLYYNDYLIDLTIKRAFAVDTLTRL